MTAVSASGSSNSGAAASAAPASRHPWRAVISASIGNALEWFDLVVYGFCRHHLRAVLSQPR